MKNTTPLARLCPKLSELYGDSGPGYARCYRLVLDGSLPTVVLNGRHFVLDSDLPAVADLLGIDTSAAPRRVA